jgi:cytochrome P450
MTYLHQELQDSFQSDSDITSTSLSQLKTLNAISQETFRIYPAVPTALPRIVTEGGTTVCGHILPPGTQVGVPRYAMNRSKGHLTSPEVYALERFPGAEEYTNDKKHVTQPFSVGPRSCVGQSLAWAEIRSILARLVWNFEFETVQEVNWEWEKVLYFGTSRV